MGLAASQARLLSITSRMADNELRSQSINNAKMRLATESSRASENYINALNDANMLFTNYAADGTAMSQTLTYNTLMSYSSYNNQYGLVNAAGQLLVDENEAKLFIDANGNINEYLKAHGLEYDTTYFDEGVDGVAIQVENPDYPDGYKSVDSATLKTWYENYPSLVNSAEYAHYQEFFGKYISESSAYKGALSYMLDDYFKYITQTSSYKDAETNITYNINSITDSNKDNWAETGNKVLDGVYNQIERFFTGEDGVKAFTDIKNRFNWNKSNWVNAKNYNDVRGVCFRGTTGVDELNGKSVDNSDDTTTTAIYKYHFGWDSREIGEDGQPVGEDTRNYLAFEVYKDKNGKEHCAVYSSYDADHNDRTKAYFVKDAADGRSAYENALYSLDSYNTAAGKKTGDKYGSIKDPNGNNLTIDYDNGKSIYVAYESAEKYKEFIQEVIDNLAETAHDSKYFNLSAFGNAVIKDYENNEHAMGLNYNTVVGKNSGKTYRDCILNYVKAAMNYFGFIEGQSAEDEDNIKLSDLEKCNLYNLLSEKNVQETYDDLTNLHTLLQIINEMNSDTRTENNVTMSGEFNNIVKSYIVDTMIDNYGEPKYTWVDRNDTTNSGNASAKAQWYTNLFNRMKSGYKILEKGLAASSDWIEYALESGVVTMEQVDKNYNWNALDYKTCTNISEQTNTDSLTAKAEAEYNRAMNEIEAKDKAYDLELKNIDTEHTALQTEYKSIQNAMKANIERTLKFDQSS